jgi:hypothetical protein
MSPEYEIHYFLVFYAFPCKHVFLLIIFLRNVSGIYVKSQSTLFMFKSSKLYINKYLSHDTKIHVIIRKRHIKHDFSCYSSPLHALRRIYLMLCKKSHTTSREMMYLLRMSVSRKEFYVFEHVYLKSLCYVFFFA